MSVRFIFPLVLFLLCCAVGVVRAQEALIISLTVHNGGASAVATFGYHENATYCLDGQLEEGIAEVELPPPPPGPASVDLRFVGSRAGMGGCTIYNEVGMGTLVDVHPWSSSLLDTFKIALLNTDLANPVELSWEGAAMSRLQEGSQLVLQDPFGGALVNFDMLAQSSVAVPAALSSLLIYARLSAKGGAPLPRAYALEQNYPNPFNPTTNLRFTICDLRFVSLKVYNVLGEEVAALVNEVKEPGEYTIPWDASGMPSGVYYYTLRAGEFTESRKLVIVR